MQEKITAPLIKSRKGGEKITMITSYDTPTAQIADRAGADIILIGDSVSTVVLGFKTTLSATVDMMVYHTAAVARANPHSLIVSDMPWLSFHLSPQDTIINAGRLVREAGAEAVKLEGGKKRVNVIKALIDAEIPVMGHLGLTPQSYHALGGYRVQGKNSRIANELIEDAKALEEAGVFSIVLEGIPSGLAQNITESISIPTIGIGAGAGCDGQVLVFHDALGLTFSHVPKFVRTYAKLGDIAADALANLFSDIKKGDFPSDKESYHMDESVLNEVLKIRGKKK